MSSGAYMVCQKTKSELYDPISGYYLNYSPNMRWVPTTVNKADKVPGVLFKDVGKRWFLMFARLCVNGVSRVGRIHYGI